MTDLSSIIATSVFIVVIGLIMSEKLHLTIAALLGALILVFTHTLTLTEAIEYISKSHATLLIVRLFENVKIENITLNV